MPLYLKKRYNAYIQLWQPFILGFSYLWGHLSSGSSDILNRTFATWYSSLGHHFAAFEASETPVPRLVSMANGTVLELGPGSGNQFPRFNSAMAVRIYGVEPNEYLFNQLRTKTIQEHGLSNIYVPIHGALEDDKLLESFGIIPESIDTIVCMQVLCSVSDPSKAAKRIHQLLKPGGQLLFWEHVANSDVVTRIVQGTWNLVWTPIAGGCRLNRDIQSAICSAGEWEIAESGLDDGQAWSLMPRVWGRFIKK